MSLSVYHTSNDLSVTKCRQSAILTRPTAQALRYALFNQACRYFGKEGIDWRMVQDRTVIGFHVRALGIRDGETLEIR